MTCIDPETTVGELVTERPGRSRIFERLGIDYCCGGKKTLGAACRERGLDIGRVVADLAEDAPSAPGTDWAKASLGDLVDHILDRHHAYLRGELPRLAGMSAKVCGVHGERHPELRRVDGTFGRLRAELEMHMAKEERVLFPMIRELEASSVRPVFHCGSLANPLRVMEAEHDAAGEALAEMRELTGGYSVPPDGCNTYRVLMDGLASLERDLHEHIHEENNILFPRALAREESLPG